MKTFCETSTEILELNCIDPTKKVRVYRNLHKKCISVKQKGIVRCHASNVVLRDCKFIVNEAGQARVRREGKKYVHAFIEGYVVEARKANELLDFGWETVYYNPYDTDHWQLAMVPYDEYVDTAQWCDVWCDETLGEVLALNLTYLEETCNANSSN